LSLNLIVRGVAERFAKQGDPFERVQEQSEIEPWM